MYQPFDPHDDRSPGELGEDVGMLSQTEDLWERISEAGSPRSSALSSPRVQPAESRPNAKDSPSEVICESRGREQAALRRYL